MPRQLPQKSTIHHIQRSAMEARPELAILIARIATGWSRAEERLGILVVQLLGADAHTGMKMYQALVSAGAQKSVLRAIARDRLSAEQLLEMEAILDRYKKAGEKRNKVVHGLWEVSKEHPKDLVWYDSGEYLLSHGEFWTHFRKLGPEDPTLKLFESYKPKRTNYLLYTKADFEEVLARIREVVADLQAFTLALDKPHKPKGDETSLGGG